MEDREERFNLEEGSRSHLESCLQIFPAVMQSRLEIGLVLNISIYYSHGRVQPKLYRKLLADPQ